MRAKLHEGMYTNLEQFEVCSYNCIASSYDSSITKYFCDKSLKLGSVIKYLELFSSKTQLYVHKN